MKLPSILLSERNETKRKGLLIYNTTNRTMGKRQNSQEGFRVFSEGAKEAFWDDGAAGQIGWQTEDCLCICQNSQNCTAQRMNQNEHLNWTRLHMVTQKNRSIWEWSIDRDKGTTYTRLTAPHAAIWGGGHLKTLNPSALPASDELLPNTTVANVISD